MASAPGLLRGEEECRSRRRAPREGERESTNAAVAASLLGNIMVTMVIRVIRVIRVIMVTMVTMVIRVTMVNVLVAMGMIIVLVIRWKWL